MSFLRLYQRVWSPAFMGSLGLSLWLTCSPTVTIARADERLAATLRQLDGTVAAAEERESLSNQVRDQLRTHLQQANQASSKAWSAIKTRADWERLRAKSLEALQASLGEFPNRSPDFRHEVTGEVAGEGFVIRNLIFETLPGWWVTANLYVPSPTRDSMPGIVILHSHHAPKHDGELQDMGMTWARAGCVVLVLDQVGHGERRQHPFNTAMDFAKPFGVGRQDYYFRYDNAMQLHLIGESLMGWMVRDVMRSVDLLLKQPGIDSTRIALLGSVAGGGDPAAVAGALDERIAAVVPFNFGGPQPETRFPLPDDIEQSFNYAGSGGWESTRNLQRSASGQFLPWVIVGAIAPRRLVYAHEFGWDREHDPVWKRLQQIYHLYEQPEFLAYTQGRGELKDRPPAATHCNHIGAPHRVRIHEAFAKWFGIEVSPETEYSNRLPADRLRCWTPEARERLQPRTLALVATDMADVSIARIRSKNEGRDSFRREQQSRWEALLGDVAPERLKDAQRKVSIETEPRVERWMLTSESGIRIPCLLLRPEKGDRHQPVVLALCSQGKNRLLSERADELAGLLERGAMICLIDPRGIGESRLGENHGRRSSATSHSSTGLMLGRPLLGEQLRDVRLVLNWLRRRPDVGFRPLVVWGESLIPANPDGGVMQIPRDDDQALPAVSEPQAPLLALYTGLFEDDIDLIYTSGGLVSWRSLLTSYVVLVAHDVIVPGALTAGDLAEVLSALPEGTRVRMDGLVDGWNRQATQGAMQVLRKASLMGVFENDRRGIVSWVAENITVP